MVKTEFHLHTAESSPCGEVFASEIISACAKKGYGCVIVTDHYLPGVFEGTETRHLFLEGFRNAKIAGKSLGITVLPGMEFRFDRGEEDFLIYGMEEEDFSSLPFNLCRYSLPDFHKYCHDHGYLLFQAHPFRPRMKVQNPAYLDGIEVQNGSMRHNSHNGLALAFARQHKLLEITGGDVHRLADVRQNGLMVPQSHLTPKGIVQFLLENPRIGPEFEELEPGLIDHN